jgi:HD-GYP domain-containing protein (c-di-GMP phosphodiesterase class II)
LKINCKVGWGARSYNFLMQRDTLLTCWGNIEIGRKIRQWLTRFYAWFTRVDAKDQAMERRGQLLAMYILLLSSLLAYVLVDNAIRIILHPTLEYTVYMLEELVIAGILYAFWRLNRRGSVERAAYAAIAFTILGVAFTSQPPYLEYIMVVFGLPIGISSFILRPSSSFHATLLAAVASFAASAFWDYDLEYNLTAVLALLALAFMTWVVARQLEDTHQKNAVLYNNLQSSNSELQNAYEITLEGWSRALDLRDRETEGHTQRVTELTMRIARAMDFTTEELVNIRRGALLHDIGKLGVPDQILHKPGPLDEGEWKIMGQHPLFAHNMIYPIEYLRPALDIPCFHHEKWDGSGYPYRLKGIQIPLAARIFALADVYDALSSDRPYRAALPREQVIAFIRNAAGSHFDPNVVEIFLKEIQRHDT